MTAAALLHKLLLAKAVVHFGWRAQSVHRAVNMPCLQENCAPCWPTLLQHFLCPLMHPVGAVYTRLPTCPVYRACWPNT